jgi:transposase
VRLLCEDEARFRRISDARRCWTPAGGRSEVSGQRGREYEYACAAVSPQDGALDTLVLPAVNTEAMSIFWTEVSQRHANELLMVGRDGAGGHWAKRLPVPAHMRLVFLPAWSPQLNPVEHVWDEVREKWFSHRVFARLAAVDEQLVKALLARETDPIRGASLPGFPWITDISLNAN